MTTHFRNTGHGSHQEVPACRNPWEHRTTPTLTDEKDAVDWNRRKRTSLFQTGRWGRPTAAVLVALWALAVTAQDAGAQDVRDLLGKLLSGEAVNTEGITVAACGDLYRSANPLRSGNPKGSSDLCAIFDDAFLEEYKQVRTTVVASTGEIARFGFCEDPSDQSTFGNCGVLLMPGDLGQYQRPTPPHSFPGCPKVPVRSDTIPDPDPYRGPEIRTETNNCVNASPMRVRIEATRAPVVFQLCSYREESSPDCVRDPQGGAFRFVTPGEWGVVLDDTVVCEWTPDPRDTVGRGHRILTCSRG